LIEASPRSFYFKLVFLRKYAKINEVMKNIIEKVEDLQAKLLHLEDCL